MKTVNRIQQVPFRNHNVLTLCSIFLAATVGSRLSVSAQETGNPVTARPAVQVGQASTNLAQAKAVTPTVSEILKMADAGVSTEVIKTYVECSPTPCQPTEVDVIALKQHNVTDEIVTLLLKRGAQVRAAIEQARNETLARAMMARRMANGGLDPDSYEYFQRFYLHPRALASVYDRLGPYSYPYAPYR